MTADSPNWIEVEDANGQGHFVVETRVGGVAFPLIKVPAIDSIPGKTSLDYLDEKIEEGLLFATARAGTNGMGVIKVNREKIIVTAVELTYGELNPTTGEHDREKTIKFRSSEAYRFLFLNPHRDFSPSLKILGADSAGNAVEIVFAHKR